MLKPCRERLLKRLLSLDDDPKIYPTFPPAPGFAIVCVCSNATGDWYGSYDDYKTDASGYAAQSRCLFFTLTCEDAVNFLSPA